MTTQQARDRNQAIKNDLARVGTTVGSRIKKKLMRSAITGGAKGRKDWEDYTSKSVSERLAMDSREKADRLVALKNTKKATQDNKKIVPGTIKIQKKRR